MKLIKQILISIIIAIVFYEGYFQLSSYIDKKKADKTSHVGVEYKSRNHFWTYQENKEFVNFNEEGERIIVKSDQLGFRNPDLNKKEYDILLLGDSFTSAMNTKDELTFANLLRKAGFSVYNAGIDGVGTVHEIYILNYVLQHIKPKMVVINFYLGNDFKDNFFCWEVPNFEKNKKIIDNNNDILVENILVSEPLLLKLKNFFHNTLINKSVFLNLLYQKIYMPLKYKEIDMAFYDRSEAKVLAFKANTADKDVESAIMKTKEALVYFKQRLENDNIKLVIVGIPSKAQVLKSIRELSGYDADEKGLSFFCSVLSLIDFDNADKLLANICSEHQLDYISLLNRFRSSPNEKLFYHFDVHWTYAGQKIAATAVLPVLKTKLSN